MDIQELYSLYLAHPAVTTDSRDCPPGSIFVALKGENFDGNQFAAAALERGCVRAIVDDRHVHDQCSDGRMILVEDALQTFKDLAREHRRRFHIPVVAITGTNGKTTTKELVRAVLSERYNVLATEGNYNNDIGVPKTLLRLTAGHHIAVIEMGASHPGDIITLAKTAEPTCGLITNVGLAHIQGFGSLEGVLHTKGELYDYLAGRPDSVIFVNRDDERLMGILPPPVGTLTYSSTTGEAGVCGQVIACDPCLRLRWRRAGEPWIEVSTHLIGSYNINNVLAAVSLGLHFGVGTQQICHALEQYVPSNNRSQLTVTATNHLIVDAYNANPTSMAAALENFRLMRVSPKMAILGEMRELGSSSRQAHEDIISTLRECGFDTVWLVGDAFCDIESPYRKFSDVEQVKQALALSPVAGHHILIKGSNGTRLFQLPPLL